MNSITKGLFGSVAIAAVVLGMSACEVPEDEAKAAPTKAEKTEAKKAAKKATAVTAKQILKEFEGNEAAADLKYKGQTLQVTGVVDKVDTEFWDEDEYVVQIGDGSRFVMWTVNCDDQSAEVAASITKGQDITVVGDFEDGGDLGIEMKNCVVL